MTNRIVLLDDNTANRIAAGEVVERPASAVKELVENAIDAGARQVAVSLSEGGKRRIEVADDGCGMNAEEAVLALQRHATSKIRSADDLFAIQTLGFRGEALPSIASVSHFTLVTKSPEQDAGARVVVRGGDIETVEAVGARDGTSIVVEDLFFNTPARLKFLKSTPAELARVLDAVGQLAVAHPGTAFTVREEGHTRLSTPGGGDPLGALAAVWGRDIARRLVPIENVGPSLHVTGFLCPPDLTRPGRSHELFFVNGRPIKSRLLSHAVEEAVRALTPESRYPIAAVFVRIAPDMVDVNVHPTKTEVKFTHDGSVHHAVSQAVKNALLAYGILPTISIGTPSAQAAPEPAAPAPSAQLSASFDALALAAFEAYRPLETASPLNGISRESGTAGALGTAVAEPRAAFLAEPQAPSAAVVAAPEDAPLGIPALPKPFAEQLRGYHVLGQARNTYIIALTEDGIAIIDQHVAHERVLYERLTEKRREHGTPAQRLAVPFTLSLSAAEAGLVRQRTEDFAAAGWDLEPFGGDAFLVRSIPIYAARKSHETLLRDIVDELVHHSVARRLVVQREHVTITNACKMAVKAGDPLSMEEMTGLLAQLADTENPYLCPHGRPIVVTIPFHDIDRKFKRA
jgi:DNA mismatch repair protein MutL